MWFLILVLLPFPLGALLAPEFAQEWIARTPMIPFALALITIVGFLVRVLCQRPEICANGLWYDGALHEWNAYESFSAKKEDDKIVVEVYFADELRSLWYPSKRIVVPPGSWEAAEKSLEANLRNLASKDRKT
ncbi:MAG: hypothetical protein V2B18_17860 [Pseudomonadota bacterium]